VFRFTGMTVFMFNSASKTVDGRVSLDRRGQLAYRSVIDESVDDDDELIDVSASSSCE